MLSKLQWVAFAVKSHYPILSVNKCLFSAKAFYMHDLLLEPESGLKKMLPAFQFSKGLLRGFQVLLP